MKFYLISDNVDTLTGLRLAGIEGVVAHTKEEVLKAFNEATADSDVGIIIITEKLSPLCPEIVYDIKLNRSKPLIVEIPDRHGTGRSKDSITRYIKEAIGIKI